MARQRTRSTADPAAATDEVLELRREPLEVGGLSLAAGRDATHHFRVLRPSDLVVLDVIGYGLATSIEDEADDKIALVPAGSRARLEVRFTFQHLLERAEPEQEIPPPPHPVPIPARAANPSRLVFDVPVGERIGFSSAGVLAAMSRLPLRVAPLALPRAIPRRFGAGQLGELVEALTLPGGIRLARSAHGLVLAPAVGGSADTSVSTSARELLTSAAALRTARLMLSGERAIDLRRPESEVAATGIGGLAFKPPIVRPRRRRPRSPRADETAIETPFRLILSPSSLGGFAHAITPQVVGPELARLDDPERVELWHTRLGVRRVDRDGVVSVDEVADAQKVVRAIWARDMDDPAPNPTPSSLLPSLTPDDRETLVRQSADPRIAPPQPVSAERLYLTSVGAWMELHGVWDVQPYTSLGIESIEAWDHEATSGRDNYVRVVKPYYLFPFGHRASLITITERKIKEVSTPQARLYQRKFITLREPVLTYSDRRMPFKQIRIRPLVTPNLDFEQWQPGDPDPPDVAGSVLAYGDDLFWPTIAGAKFRFLLDCIDHDGRRVILRAPLLAVGAHLGSTTQKNDIITTYEDDVESPIPGDGQSIAMAKPAKSGDTAFETVTLRFTGVPGDAGDQRSDPLLAESDIVVPAMRHLAPASKAVTVSYAEDFVKHGFLGANATGEVLLALKNMTDIQFGGGTDQAGGFVQPDLPVRGLSRAIGILGDIDSVNVPDATQAFDPDKFLSGVLPKLFGLFELTDILAIAGLDEAPAFITEQLDKITGLIADLEALVDAVDRAADRLHDDVTSAATTALRNQAAQAEAAIVAIRTDLETAVQSFNLAVKNLMALDVPSDLPDVIAAVSDVLDDIAGFVTNLQTTVRALPMPPTAKADLERLVGALSPLLDAAEIATTIEGIADLVNGIDPANLSIRARYEWRPRLTNFPSDATTEDQALFFVDPQGFVLSVEARASGADGVGLDVLAELSDFGLNLFPDASLIKIRFDRIAFRASSGRKPEVDVVFTGIEWQGILRFIDTLQNLIPFDGFSDPPYVDVSADGVTAGFDLALPAVAVGVFSLENISLGADVRVPFLGDAVTVGFYFCTREKPFRLTVMAIGGGGFVGIRLSPKGLVVLEMSLEAGASLSINLGVASGSVSVMVGVYMRLEGDAGELTGYFRIRGEVDVLGLISASITLELALTYEFGTGKMVGRASITIEISLLFFSMSVEVSCERRLAGSNGDPTLAQILGVPDDGTPITDVPAAWSDYCVAFAGG